MTKRDIPNLSPIIFHQRRVTPLSIKISSYIFQKIVNNHNIIEKKLDLGKRFSLRMEPLSYFFLVARGRFVCHLRWHGDALFAIFEGGWGVARVARGRFVCHLRRWLVSWQICSVPGFFILGVGTPHDSFKNFFEKIS